MKKNVFMLLLAILGLCLTTQPAQAATDLDILSNTDENGEWTDDGHTFSTKEGYYQEWEHYYVFWDKLYGKQADPQNVKTLGSGNYFIDLVALHEYAEMCYDVYVHQLGFGVPQHKIQISLYYATTWYADANGWSGYGTMRLAHSSVNGNYFTFCHEVGHAYQFCCRGLVPSSAFGRTSYYTSYFEACANWQASQIYPAQYYSTCWDLYHKTLNLALTHEWHGYQFYPINDYWLTMRDEKAVGKIWSTAPSDRNNDLLQMYMQIYGANAAQVYKEIFWEAMRTVTWDLPRWQAYINAEPNSQLVRYMSWSNGTSPTGSSTYQYVVVDAETNTYQVAYSSCPMSTGFNIVKLKVPTGDDRTVTTSFTALEPGCELASGDPRYYWKGDAWVQHSALSTYNTELNDGGNSTFNTYKTWRGFRLGYVAYNSTTGERTYNYTDDVLCTGTGEQTVNIQFTVPEGADQLYLVVSPALSRYLRRGGRNPYYMDSADDNAKRGDMWPYRLKFYNTDLAGRNQTNDVFEGEALTGEDYSSYTLPDYATLAPKSAYTIRLSDAAPDAASFTTAETVYAGNEPDQYLSLHPITAANSFAYVYPFELPGYNTGISFTDNQMTVNYVDAADASLTKIRNMAVLAGTQSSVVYSLTSSVVADVMQFIGVSAADFTSNQNWLLSANLQDGKPGKGEYYLYGIDASTGEIQPSDTDDDGRYVCHFDADGRLTDSDEWAFALSYDHNNGNRNSRIAFYIDSREDLPIGTSARLQVAVGTVDDEGNFRLVKFVFNTTIAEAKSSKVATIFQLDPASPQGAGFRVLELTRHAIFGNYEGANISAANVMDYVTVTDVADFEPVVSVDGSIVTISYQSTEPTAIEEISTNYEVQSTIYDLTGRRVSSPTKGIYIIGGRKVLLR